MGADREHISWVATAQNSMWARWRLRCAVLCGLLLACAVGFLLGRSAQPIGAASPPPIPEATPPREASPAQLKAAKTEALIELARDWARQGRYLMARSVYERALAQADEPTRAKVRQALEALKAQARNHERILNERSYELFAQGLNDSSRQINECRFHGVTYSCTKYEARAMFARYLEEHQINPVLQANIGYPMFCWGENHANLQWGLAQAVADVMHKRLEVGKEALGACLEKDETFRRTLQIALGYVRRIGEGPEMSAPDKGRIYWRLSDALAQLPKMESQQTPLGVKDFVVDLKNTLAPFAPHKNLVPPAPADPENEEVF